MVYFFFVVLQSMKELTKAEEQVMQILWDLQEGFLRDIVQKFPEPKPAPTTVSTIVRILERKDFVSHKSYGTNNMYFPIISKRDYSKSLLRNFVQNYFENSYSGLVSFFAEEGKISIEELEQLRSEIDTDKEEE